MHAFEYLVSVLFQRENYWTAIGYKINISKDLKKRLNNDSMPRPEIDVLAYKPGTNELLWIECKSFFNSNGVRAMDIIGDGPNSKRYKIFNNFHYNKLLTDALIKQLILDGRITDSPTVFHCLVVGKVCTFADEMQISSYFNENNFLLFPVSWLKQKISDLAESNYEDEVLFYAAKIMMNN